MNGVLILKSKEWYQDRLSKLKPKSIKPPEPTPTPVSKKKEWKLYRDEVWRITREQDLQSLDNYKKRITPELIKEHGGNIFRSTAYYSLDHKVSVWYGWKNNISPETIGHITNLRYILCLENTVKGIKCV